MAYQRSKLSKINVNGNIFGCSGDKLLEKQIEYVKELTLAKVDTSEITKNIEMFDMEIKKIIEKRKTELQQTNRTNWNKAGWFSNVQTKGIQTIYKDGSQGMCYNCGNSYNTPEEALNCNWVYILPHKNIPSFMSKTFIRLYLICSKCEKNAKVISPPKTWQEAIITSVYNEANSKMITITNQIIKEQLIATMIQTSEKLHIREMELEKQVAEREAKVITLDATLKKYDKMVTVKSTLLSDMIQSRSDQFKLLQKEEDELRQQIDVIEQRLIAYRKQLASQMEAIKTDVSSEINTMSSNLANSTIGKLNSSLKSMDDNMCQVCYDNKINIVLEPCGHLFICDECYSAIPNSCPYCRAPVNKTIKVYKP
jgi:hypothetical protein